MLRELSHSADIQPTVPDVRAERCVHTLTEQATCRACVDACPTAAWIIDDEMLGIDATRCDGCDLCVAACPEAAIVQRFRPEVRRTPQGNVALACCERAQLDGDELPRMPCLHAIGISDLLHLARDRVRYLVSAAGDCENCPRGKGERLDQRLRSVNHMLVDRKLPMIVHRPTDAAHWQRIWEQVDALAKQKSVSRRSFFRAAVEEPTKRFEAILDRAEGRHVPPGTLLPRVSPDNLVPYAPHIDAGRCSGCDACVRLCPHDAICLETEGPVAKAYVIVVDQCSGCGICTDVCEQKAVTVEQWLPLEREKLSLSNHSCRACGIKYHVPTHETGDEASENLCPICLRTGHHRQLFQVLD